MMGSFPDEQQLVHDHPTGRERGVWHLMNRIKPISPVQSAALSLRPCRMYLFIFLSLQAGHHGGFMQLHGVGALT